jgi:hypothetical protein
MPATTSPPLESFLQLTLQIILQELQKYGKEAAISNTAR